MSLRSIYKPILLIIATIIFFFSYNTFMLDRSLEELKTSLDMIGEAESGEEADSVKTVLGFILVDKVGSEKFNSAEIATLDYSHSVMAKGAQDDTRELSDAGFSIKHIVKKGTGKRKRRRGGIVATLDAINSGAVKVAEGVRTFSRRLVYKADRGEDIDEELLSQARANEDAWKLSKAKEDYEELIKRYPDYKNIKFIKLRLGTICQKMGLRQKAEDIFSDIVKRYHGTVESKSAKQLLASVKSSWEVEEKRDKLLKEIGHITQEGALQRSYFDLGLLNVRLMDFREAKNAFLKVIDIKPISELAERAKFNIGWCYKFRGKLDKSITTFEELLEKYPETKLAIDANCQIANIFHSKGDHEAAIKKYKEVADKFEKNELAPVALLYRSMIYLYDEGDLDNARIAFDELKKRYPYFWAVRSNGEYSKELIMREKAAAKGWLDSILLKGAVGFANVILNTSRPEAIGKKTPFSRFWSEKEMNGIVTRMLEKVGLAKNVKDTRVDFKLDEVDLNGSANLGIIHISAYAKAGAEPSRGGLKFTVIKYRFTFGKSNIPVPVPRFIVNRVIRRMNSMLTRKEIMLSVSEVKLTENDLTINGFRY